ncbi:MAG TPA: hypothetical protein VFP80_02655 [Thermoanaerobaculia bacterium]|nr:hypothetical protein [Thermoanaerobaculia bacterium]
MTRPKRAAAPQHRRERRPAWVRPLVRASRAISESARLIGATLGAVRASECHAERRPVHASRKIHKASGRLVHASERLVRAARQIAWMEECLSRDPEHSAEVVGLFLEATASWICVAGWLDEVAGDVFAFHREVLTGLETGTLVPEPAGGRPRIVLAPRPVPIRAFLRLRQPRVIDRIAPILRRRRRTPRRTALHVPPDTDQGRAPPLSSI